jgi:hypothetical protein
MNIRETLVTLLFFGIACAKKFATNLISTPLLSNALFKDVVLEFTANPVYFPLLFKPL